MINYTSIILHKYTGFIKIPKLCRMFNGTNSSLSIQSIEVIGITSTYNPSVNAPEATPTKTQAIFSSNPMSFNEKIVFKFEIITLDSLGSINSSKVIWAEIIIILIVRSIPSGYQRTNNYIIDLTVNIYNSGILVCRIVSTIIIKVCKCAINNLGTGQLNTIHIIGSALDIPSISNNNAVNIGLAISINTVEEFAANYASQLAVNYIVLMISNGKNSTPINY